MRIPVIAAAIVMTSFAMADEPQPAPGYADSNAPTEAADAGKGGSILDLLRGKKKEEDSGKSWRQKQWESRYGSADRQGKSGGDSGGPGGHN